MSRIKWLMIFYDPEDYLDQNILDKEKDDSSFYKIARIQEKLNKFLDVDIVLNNCKTYGNIVDDYISHVKSEKRPDHICIVYDGHWSCDGIANQSFFAISYKSFEINHHSYSLIDSFTKTKYEKEKIFSLFAESIYNLYEKCVPELNFNEEEHKEKNALLEELKTYF